MKNANVYQIDGFCFVDNVVVPEGDDAYELIKAAIIDSLNADISSFTENDERLLTIANEILSEVNNTKNLDDLCKQFDIFTI